MTDKKVKIVRLQLFILQSLIFGVDHLHGKPNVILKVNKQAQIK